MESIEPAITNGLRERIDALEARLERVERRGGTDGVIATSGPAVTKEREIPGGQGDVLDEDPEALWALTELKHRIPAPGGVLYTGAVTYGAGRQAQWQWAIARDDVLDVDPDVTAQSLAALAHPVRIRILTAVLRGVQTVAALSHELDITASGQAYHHVHQLTAQGWLSTVSRGHYEVPVARVVPALVILAASGEPREHPRRA